MDFCASGTKTPVEFNMKGNQVTLAKKHSITGAKAV